jgi:WD40 repeat protein
MKYLLFGFLVLLILTSCIYFAPASSSANPDEYFARLDDIGEVTDIDWSSDSKHVVVGGDQLHIYEIDPHKLTLLNWIGGGPVTDVAWQPTGQMIVATNSPDVDIWDSVTQIVQISLEDHIQFRIFNSASWSPSGDMLAVTGQGSAPRGIVKIWDTSDFQVIHTITPDFPQDEHSGYSSIVFSTDSNSIAFTSIGTNVIEVRNTVDWELMLALEGHEAIITGLSWHGQKTWLASSDRDGSVTVWDLSTGQEIYNSDVSSTLTAIDWSTSEDRLALATSDGVLIWNLSDNTTIELLSESANDVSWSPDGNLLAVAVLDGLILLDMTGDE